MNTHDTAHRRFVRRLVPWAPATFSLRCLEAIAKCYAYAGSGMLLVDDGRNYQEEVPVIADPRYVADGIRQIEAYLVS